MLKNLENIYLNILRVVVIVASGLLLVAAILSAISALGGLMGPPKPSDDLPELEYRPLIDQVKTTLEEKRAKPTPESGDETNQEEYPAAELPDPHQAYVDRVVKAWADFVTKTGTDGRSVDIQKAGKWIWDMANRLEDLTAREAYLVGLAEFFEKSLAEEAIINEASATDPFSVVQVVIESYNQDFSAQLDATETENAEKMAEYETDKAESQQAIYVAGATFLAFLLIVFLSIFIRIERNLRCIEVLANKQP